MSSRDTDDSESKEIDARGDGSELIDGDEIVEPILGQVDSEGLSIYNMLTHSKVPHNKVFSYIR